MKIKQRMIRNSSGLQLAFLMGLLLVLLSVGVAWGQENPPTGEVTNDQVNDVARELWCPLCSGVRLDSCELNACDQMKDVIAIKLSEGEDTTSIKDYFVEQYGPQVLGEPPRQGFSVLAWLLPILVALGGIVFLWSRARTMIRPAAQGASVNASLPVKTDAKGDAEADEYSRQLDEQLTKYG